MLIAGCASPAPTQPPSPTEAPKPQELRIAIAVSGGPPFDFYTDGDPTKPLIGLEPDILNAVAECMGVKINFYDAGFDGILPGLLSNKWDVGAGTFFVTKQRAAMVDFADPYMDSDTGVMIKKGAQLHSFADMKGKVLGADTGSAAEAWLKANGDKYGFTYKTYDDLSQVWLDVAAGRIDGGLGDTPEITFYIKDYKDTLDLGMALGAGYKQAFAFRKGDPNLPKFNQCQRDLKKNGKIGQFYQTYFGAPCPKDSSCFTTYENAPYVPDK